VDAVAFYGRLLAAVDAEKPRFTCGMSTDAVQFFEIITGFH
jgi:hypothetical protein